ncbi:diguanylate cyclase [Aquamicrobium sp. NLF2-7]|uniref:GGDEF domain-containing protein n=1 Tax=Aquamicrobium sp. NLF2-7 TaxID=2918753 RepID=UPI001EFB0F08|nr:diguanylate cyclase [Aquamicrobium sp. NLF2-7]MCG8270138.1 diguanylate cyclase [Aquamicrobium sp. NLF2-7]
MDELLADIDLAFAGAVVLATFCCTLVVAGIGYRRTRHHQDRLTGILNQRGFERRVKTILKGQWNAPISLVLCALHHSRPVGDASKAAFDDRVLSEIGTLLRDAAGSVNVVGRMEEASFAILLQDTTNEGALRWVGLLRKAIDDICCGEPEKRIPIIASFGFAEVMERDTLDTLMKRAEARLYVGRHRARNRAGAPENHPAIVPEKAGRQDRPDPCR